MIIEPLPDLSAHHDEARRAMRAKLLTIADQELHDLYYAAVTLAEHEARRRGRADITERCNLSNRAEA